VFGKVALHIIYLTKCIQNIPNLTINLKRKIMEEIMQREHPTKRKQSEKEAQGGNNNRKPQK
jgi:hypothetical protein